MKLTRLLIGTTMMVMMGCQSSMLTTQFSEDMSDEDAEEVPSLIRDLSHIQYIDMPDEDVDKNNPMLHPETGNAFNDYLKVDRLIALGDIPGEYIAKVKSLEIDDNKIFVCYVSTKTPIRTERDRYEVIKKFNDDNFNNDIMTGLSNAVFDIKGRFIAKLDISDMHMPMSLNKKTKEVVLTDIGNKQLHYFSYKGEHLRSEKVNYSRLMYNEKQKFLDDSRMMTVKTTGYRNTYYYMGFGKDNEPMFKMELGKKSIRQGGINHNDGYLFGRISQGDGCVWIEELDTIWQITPKKAVARYVFRGEEKLCRLNMSGALSYIYTTAKHDMSKNLAHSDVFSAVYSDNINIMFWENDAEYGLDARGFLTKSTIVNYDSHFGVTADLIQLYDAKTKKQLICQDCCFTPRSFWYNADRYFNWDGSVGNTKKNKGSGIDHIQDGYQWSEAYPLALKEIASNCMDIKQAEYYDEIEKPTDKELDFVHKLKLDGNPVIIIKKIMMENVGMKEYIDFYKKKGTILTTEDIRNKFANMQTDNEVITSPAPAGHMIRNSFEK